MFIYMNGTRNVKKFLYERESIKEANRAVCFAGQDKSLALQNFRHFFISSPQQ